jgi:hypothetical protein
MQPMKYGLTAKLVMPGPVPGIHVLLQFSRKDVDGRDKLGHDENETRLMVAANCFASSAMTIPAPGCDKPTRRANQQISVQPRGQK